MSEVIHLKKSHIIGIISIVFVFIGFCVYGYFLLKDNQKTENCWDKYTTEQEAIQNCEGTN